MASHRRSSRVKTQKLQGTSSEAEEDDPLSELTRPQLLQINRIFKSIASRNPPRSFLALQRASPLENSGQFNEQARLESEDENFTPGGFVVDLEDDGDHISGGGFIAEEGGDDEGGGFMVEDESPLSGGFLTTMEPGSNGPPDQGPGTSKTPKQPPPVPDAIPLRCVPEALRLLGLPYMDSDVLEVFEQAASSDEEDPMSQTRWVNRRQFTRVCAALMVGQGSEGTDRDEGREDQANDPSPTSGSAASFGASTPAKKKRRTTRGSKAVISDNSCDSDESFIPPEKYIPNRKARAKTQTRGSRKKPQKDLELDNFDNVLDSFQLFFPEDSTKDRSAITFADIRRIADELDEKMTDAEIKEMLDYASGTNDSCVDLTAFERILREMKAV